MADKGDDEVGTAALVSLAGLGLGFLVGAAVFGGAGDPRTAFESRLRETLAEHGIGLLTASFGQDPTRAGWVLGLRLPDERVVNVEAPVTPEAPFSAATCDDVARRVIRFVAEVRTIHAA